MQAELIAAIVPSLPANASPAIETPSERSFVVQALGATVIAVFGAGSIEVPARLSAEASAATVTLGEGGTSFFAADATRLAADGDGLLEASAPVTLSYRHTRDGGRITVAAGVPADITVATGLHHIARVHLSDGTAVPSGTRITRGYRSEPRSLPSRGASNQLARTTVVA